MKESPRGNTGSDEERKNCLDVFLSPWLPVFPVEIFFLWVLVNFSTTSAFPAGLHRLRSVPTMDWLNLLQWPAMVVTLIAAWAVGSIRSGRREWGFWLFIVSNVLWIVWGFSQSAWALIVLQVGLFGLNIRGAKKNEAAAE